MGDSDVSQPEHLEFRAIPIDVLFEDGGGIFDDHWEEVPTLNHDDIGLELDKDKYRQYEAVGHLSVVGAYDEDKLVGYVVMIADSMQQHKGMWQAVTDVVYLKPEYRKGTNAQDLIRFCEEHLKKYGIDFFQIHVNMVYDFSKLPESLGYDFAYKIYNKRLS